MIFLTGPKSFYSFPCAIKKIKIVTLNTNSLKAANNIIFVLFKQRTVFLFALFFLLNLMFILNAK